MMSYEPMKRTTVPVTDRADALRGAGLLRSRCDADRIEITLAHPDGTRESVAVSFTTAGLIADFLEQAAAAEEFLVLREAAEISPERAATILGVSRPLVRRRMDAGELPFHRVGGHRRIRLADVLELKSRDERARAAQEELRADTEDLMAHGL